jgi:hypothetical protein
MFPVGIQNLLLGLDMDNHLPVFEKGYSGSVRDFLMGEDEDSLVSKVTFKAFHFRFRSVLLSDIHGMSLFEDEEGCFVEVVDKTHLESMESIGTSLRLTVVPVGYQHIHIGTIV